MLVFINPGHDSAYENGRMIDPGACNGIYREAEIALDIGHLVAKYVSAAGIPTIVMQSDNLAGESPEYPCVCDRANDEEADIFVSIHCNAATPAARGVETFCYSKYDRYGFKTKGYKLAKKIQRQLADSLDTIDRGVKEANFIVLKHTDMPAVLVECAFISNEDDLDILVNEQDEIARAIARGITDYFQD